MRCFIDLAGVLTDWNTATHKLHGLSYSHDEEKYPYPLGLWDWTSTLPTPEVPLSAVSFFAPLGREFYATLPWMSDGPKIMNYMISVAGWRNLYILSTPLKTPGSMEGTLEWVRREIPILKDRVILTTAKEACASPNAILLDDREENIDLFNEHGGFGILVPRIWNRNLNYREAPLDYIKSCVEGFLTQESERN